jgi:DNA-binding MarR family transcriptional regulator
VVEILLVLASVVFALSAGEAVIAYRYLRKAQSEYEKAKEAIDYIVVSFKRELKREAENLELVAYKVEAVSSKGDNALKQIEGVDKRLNVLEPKMVAVIESDEKALTMLGDLDKRTHDIVASQEVATAKIFSLEEQTQRFSSIPEARVDAVIPIKREKALAPLTETELAALEMLAREGPKTAPEIKAGIQLSREHTARLMKKLYESGYLERDSSKIPFKYSVKKEMEKFLKKAENEASQSP